MFKLDLRTILLLVVMAVVGWTQWKIYSQEKTISDLNTSLTDSQQKVSNLSNEVSNLREQMRIDREAVKGWFEQSNQLREEQQGHQSEVKDVLAKFQYELAFNTKQTKALASESTQPQVPSYRIGDSIAIPAIDGMWNAFTTTGALAGLADPNTGTLAEKSAGGTPTQ